MTAGDIALLIGAVAGLITAVGAFISSLQRKAAADADRLEKDLNQTRRELEIALRHIHDQGKSLATHGIDGPPMPDELKTPGQTGRLL